MIVRPSPWRDRKEMVTTRASLAESVGLGLPRNGGIWAIGERIRKLLLNAPRLRADPIIKELFANIASDRRAHRGRQSFVMLLGYRSCAEYAIRLIEHIDDSFVDGHVVNTIYKMLAPGFSDRVRPLVDDKMAWVRNEAKRYLAWDAASNKAMQTDAASRRR